MKPDLVQYLRQIPLTASADLQSADLDPEAAAGKRLRQSLRGPPGRIRPRGDEASAQRSSSGWPWRRSPPRYTWSSTSTRRRARPASSPTPTCARSLRGRGCPGSCARRWRLVTRYWLRSGTTWRLGLDLGAMGGCDRYHLTAEAPFDTWFSSARIERAGATDGETDPSYESVDTSQGFRLGYTETSSPTPWPGVLEGGAAHRLHRGRPRQRLRHRLPRALRNRRSGAGHPRAEPSADRRRNRLRREHPPALPRHRGVGQWPGRRPTSSPQPSSSRCGSPSGRCPSPASCWQSQPHSTSAARRASCSGAQSPSSSASPPSPCGCGPAPGTTPGTRRRRSKATEDPSESAEVRPGPMTSSRRDRRSTPSLSCMSRRRWRKSSPRS